MAETYDAVLVLSFGGPEGRDDVIPFLERVLEGKNVPRQRMLEVAEHYYLFGGVSPINSQNRALIDALRGELETHGLNMPVYWGNRNWHPLLADTVRQMKEDGIRRALAFVTSVFSSYSGCRQYLEDIRRARDEVGEGAPQIDKIRSAYNHPGFVNTMAERVQSALSTLEPELRSTTQIVFTAHSIPKTMAQGCLYVSQLQEACRLVSEVTGCADWSLVYQSRSGPPHQPWLEPDVCDYLRDVADTGQITAVVLVPIGFTSDHIEVLYDLDSEAKQLCDELGLPMARAETAGTHPLFVTMIRQLIEERMSTAAERLALGPQGPSHDVCPPDCCPSGRPPSRAAGAKTKP
jgi:ferrochelatase